MEEQNKAILTAKKFSIETIDTADIMLVLDLPATEVEFQLTYNPNAFQFIENSVQSGLTEQNVDTSHLGIIKFNGKSQDPNVTTSAVQLSFKPRKQSPIAGFIATGLVTNTGAILTIPTVNITVKPTSIAYISSFHLNPDINGMNNMQPFGMSGMTSAGNSMQNTAIITAKNFSIETIDTADIMLVLDLPASNISFQLTYNPNIFKFIENSVVCTLDEIHVDTSIPGIIKFNGSSQNPAHTASTVEFSFKPLQKALTVGFIANNLSTNTRCYSYCTYGKYNC